MEFRQRLLSTLAAVRPLLQEPGVLVVGSEVPNLLQPDAAATLVVSQDVDLAIPVSGHARVKHLLSLVHGFRPSNEEPSVFTPETPGLMEVNLLGMDSELRDPSHVYVLEDRELPLLVFGALSLLQPGMPVEVEGLRIPVPRVAGLLVEKLLSDRTGEKGERDLLVALGLLQCSHEGDIAEIDAIYVRLDAELRHAIRSNLTVLSLLPPRAGVPDPTPHRAELAALLERLERLEGGAG